MNKKSPSDIVDELEDFDYGLDFQESDQVNGFEKINSIDFKGFKAGVLLFNNKKYATNLIWLTVDTIDKQESVYKKAKQYSKDFYCSRLYVDQLGFGSIEQGHKMGLPSVAATVADLLVGEWHGVFKADNGWLYLAVHSDNIAPEGDLFFQAEDEAYAYFLNESKKFKWPKTFAPAHWQISDSDGEITLGKLLENPSLTTLKPVNLDAVFGSKTNKNSVFVLGVCLSLLFVLFYSGDFIIPEKAVVPTQDIGVSDSISAPPRQGIAQKDPIDSLFENTSLINPVNYLSECVEGFDDFTVSIPGWDISLMRCRGNFVESIWKKGVGSLENLRDNLEDFPFDANKIYGSNGDFLASKVLSKLTQFSVPLKLSNREDALLELNNRFSSLGNIQITDVAPIQQNIDQNANSNFQDGSNIRRNYNTQPMTLNEVPSLNVQISSKSSPIKILNNFNLSGLSFNSVEWDFTNNQWLYDFQIYLYPDNYKVTTNENEAVGLEE